MQDAVYAQQRILAVACEDLDRLRKTFDAEGVHLSIIRALDDAIHGASDACNALNYALRMLRQAGEQAAKP
jgi:hypothetical protein